MSDKEKTCASVQEIIDRYLDGDSPADEAARVESHVLSCRTCAEELALAKRVRLALRELPEQRCPDRIADAVLERVGKESRAERREVPVPVTGRYRQVWRPAAVAAMLLAVAITALVLKEPKQPSPTVSSEELARAEQQVKWTLAYLGELGRRSAVTVREDVFESRVVFPIQKALETILEEEATDPECTEL